MLTADERRVLDAVARSRMMPAAKQERAHMLLACADGVPIAEIPRSLHTPTTRAACSRCHAGACTVVSEKLGRQMGGKQLSVIREPLNIKYGKAADSCLK
jgi:hypothetical protein